MAARRRGLHRKLKENVELLKKPVRTYDPAVEPTNNEIEERENCTELQSQAEQQTRDGYIPIAVALEILAQEYEEGAQGDLLCRVALRLAEESGVLDRYRARWDNSEDDQSGRSSIYLYDRRQAMELFHYHRRKGNLENSKREKEKLDRIEGLLLMGGVTPARVTEEDLEELERFIKESGF